MLIKKVNRFSKTDFRQMLKRLKKIAIIWRSHMNYQFMEISNTFHNWNVFI